MTWTSLLKALRRGAWVLAGALWAGELLEAVRYPHWLCPAADSLIDAVTACFTLSLVAWTLAERSSRSQQACTAQVDGLVAVFEDVVRRATPGHPLRAVRNSERDSA